MLTARPLANLKSARLGRFCRKYYHHSWTPHHQPEKARAAKASTPVHHQPETVDAASRGARVMSGPTDQGHRMVTLPVLDDGEEAGDRGYISMRDVYWTPSLNAAKQNRSQPLDLHAKDPNAV